MRLINTVTFELREFFDDLKPEYAILSHTWGPAVDEVSYQDMACGKWRTINNNGAAKIRGFCTIAYENGYEWGWIDTCCIDKSSSAELSESINSMYRWYQEAHICYALLNDANDKSDLHSSRWFTRGWTLQELLAPPEVEFYNSEWREICTRSEASKEISRITGVTTKALVGLTRLTNYSVATRMSWAARRSTTREEDIAYCLLGIFEVNMPLLYGEGTKAFQRLQEEILKTTEDYTLLAWPGASDGGGVLANSPRNFQNRTSLRFVDWSYNDIKIIKQTETYRENADLLWPGGPSIDNRDGHLKSEFDSPRLTARGLRLQLPIIDEYLPRDKKIAPQKVFLLFLNCYRQSDNEAVCIRLSPSSENVTCIYTGPYYRSSNDALHFVKASRIAFTTRTIYLQIGRAGMPARKDRHPPELCLFWFGKTSFPKSIYTRGYFSKNQRHNTDIIYLAISRGTVHAFVVCSSASCRLVRNNNAELPNNVRGIAPNNMMGSPQSRAMMRFDTGEVAHCALRLRPKQWLDMFAHSRVTEREKESANPLICALNQLGDNLDWMKDITESCTVQVWIEPESEMPVTMHLWDESKGIWSASPLERQNDKNLGRGFGSVNTIAPWTIEKRARVR
ncbi:heterokaryon incompatibility protein-domain-containing protein [Xylaria sp. FL1042]|nr:heterokaryon incompatibility protein-domain-containing protein [Xylaria sp. FL1042]